MSTISSSTTTTTGYVVTSDTTGTLVIQTGATPTTAMTVSSAQVVTLANALPVASGGTGQITANASFNAIAPSQTSNSGKYLTTDGTNSSWASVSASAATPTALGTVYGQTLVSFSSQFSGYQAGNATATGANNTVAGYQAGLSLTSGNLNTLFGKQAGTAITSSSGNSIFGADSGKSFTTGNYNVAMGLEALRTSTTSTENTAIGSYALQAATTGGANVAVGYNAGGAMTTATNNVFVGKAAGQAVTTQGGYTFVGYQAGANTTINGNASAFGQNALVSNTTGYAICAIGDDALKANTTGFQNTAVGSGAMSANTTGTYNNCLGASSFGSLTTGDSNIAMGRGAGTTISTGNNCIYIGRDANASATGSAKENVFGYGLTGKGDFTTFIGTVGTSNVYQVNNSASWATTSDFRLKKNIVDNNQGLDVISQIRVRNFEYRTEKEVTELPTSQVIKKSGVQLGVIAQELQAVLPDCVKQESTGVFTVDSDNLTWYLINAVKELKAELDALKAKVA